MKSFKKETWTGIHLWTTPKFYDMHVVIDHIEHSHIHPKQIIL